MLKLRNINICYGNNEVITEGKIELNPGDLCLISGDSGSGKSSLLDILSLQNKGNHTYEYYWKNEDVLSFDEKEKSDFLYIDLACVAQNNLIFGEFTVNENLESFCEIGYGEVKKDLIVELVDKLRLQKILDKKAKKLSGGEKQRVAIACAVLKNAELYLFDEPTSMIDIDRKEVVYKLLKDLASQGKIIVVVSHELDPLLFNKVYKLENKEIVLVKDNKEIFSELKKQKAPIKLKELCIKLANRFFFSQPYVNAMYLFVISICIALIVNILGFANSSIKAQQIASEVVSSPELFIVNSDTFDYFGGYDQYCAFPISDADYESIKKMNHVTYVDRYIYFPLDAYFDESRNNMITGRMIEQADITLKIDGKEVYSFNYYEYTQEPGVGGNMYAIYPTYEHQHIEEKCSSVIDGEGIYISKEMANKLGIEEITNQVINLYFTVPIGNLPATFTDGTTGKVCPRRCMYSALVNMDFPIKGIVDTNEYYYYMIMYKAHFFLDIEDIMRIQLEYWEKYKSDINQLSNTEQEFEEFTQYYDSKLIDSDIWRSSAIVVQVDDNENIEQVINEITNLNPLLSVAVKSSGMNDISNGMTNNVVMTAILYSLIIYGILFVSVSILKNYRRKNRKNDYTLLIKNGIDEGSISLIEVREIYLEIMISVFLSIVISYFISKLFIIFGYAPHFSLWMIGVLVLLIVIAIFLGNLFSKKLSKG